MRRGGVKFSHPRKLGRAVSLKGPIPRTHVVASAKQPCPKTELEAARLSPPDRKLALGMPQLSGRLGV